MNDTDLWGRTESEWIDHASTAYARHCKRKGYIYRQPDVSFSSVIEYDDDTFVRLRNVTGTLAVYRITGGRLRMVDPAKESELAMMVSVQWGD